MRVFFKYSDPDEPDKRTLNLVLWVDKEDDSYDVRSGEIRLASGNGWKSIKVDNDTLSPLLVKHGFDENDVRMELEDAVNDCGKEEIV